MLNTSNILLLLKEKYIFPKISCIFSNSLSYLKVFNDDHNSVTDETPNSQPDTINSEDSSNNDEPNLSDHSNEMSKLLEFELNREEWTIFKYVEEILRSFSEAIKLEYLEERSGNNEIDKLKNCSENDFDQYELLKHHVSGDPLGFDTLDRVDCTKTEQETKGLHKQYVSPSTNSNSLDIGFTTGTKCQPKSSLLQSFHSSSGKRQPCIV
ncbi:unnamed protein product [Rotaria socialis]|uniref:Uncharacterized protein n=1 Tax=Rotaria socialis TaxID=392032 RepID=A0A817XPU1_9BILA|nr:unnamed protein product [Rotaria socialis]